MTRRTFLALYVNGAGALVGGIIIVPIALNLIRPALGSRGEEWQDVGPSDSFPMDTIVAAKVRVAENAGTLNYTGVFVWRQSSGDFVVYSRACTDLGCPLTFDPKAEWFFCPCHGGIFDKTGRRRAGPPKEPMWRYKTRVLDGRLQVNLHSVPPMV